MKKYTVVQLGLGNRGLVHMRSCMSFGERMEVVGICELNRELADKTAAEYGISRVYTDVEEMLSELRPEIFSFATPPTLRLELIKLAAKYGVKGILMEKPIATSLEEAREIVRICDEHNIKTAVCHQHKYLQAFQELKKAVDSGELGRIDRVTGETASQFSLNGTHYIDYMLWANNSVPAVSVAGHVHGRNFLDNDHPSSDFLMGEIIFANGVRGNIQCGYMTKAHKDYPLDYNAPDFPVAFPAYLEDDRLTVYGEQGYAWAECNGRWAIFSARTAGKVESGVGKGIFFSQDEAQTTYTREFIEWMDDDERLHPCNLHSAYQGYELVEAVCLSALEHRRVDIPMLPPYTDTLNKMREILPECDLRKFPLNV